ncbi:MAG TPA: family 10 glycosylhydrolase, partial [Chitinophaga sp.]
NAVIVQVRPAADAFYASQLEPWSEYLTGTQGMAPNPYYDPLAFMIEETHKRGMEFHAWFNPYRAAMNAAGNVSPTHITRLRPSWFITYDGRKYFDPGIPEVRDYVNQVVSDVVRRYDIDAVHFDDYFYPYPVPGRDFNDGASYRRYGQGMPRDDWRRANVDSLITRISASIKAIKPYVKFGISPFGVWRNHDRDFEGSFTHGGQTNYDDLYANVLLWLRNGWIDYAAPQLYWEFNHRLVAYDVLVAWWAQHGYGRQIYIGHGVYKLGTTAPWRNPNELPMQIRAARSLATVQGSIFYSAKSFAGNPYGIQDSLRTHFYKYPALRPEMSWIKYPLPIAPYFSDAFEKPGGLEIHWADNDTSGLTQQYVLYRFEEKEPVNFNDASKILAIVPQMPDPVWMDATYVKGKNYTYYVTALNRLENESAHDLPLQVTVEPNGRRKFIFE